jgi:hypothetical protein
MWLAEATAMAVRFAVGTQDATQYAAQYETHPAKPGAHIIQIGLAFDRDWNGPVLARARIAAAD